jgi:serine protease Do
MAVVVAGGSYLGVGTEDIDSGRAKSLKLKEERGAEITKVYEDSPAAKAGFKEGDVVLEFNGQAVQGTEQLARMVRETPPGRQVKIVVWRNGSNQTLTATVETRKTDTPIPGSRSVATPFNMPQFIMPDIPRFEMNWQNARLGIVGEALGKEEQFADFFGVKEGVLVKSVEKDSAAEKGGIKAGDVVVKVGDTRVTSTEEITRALRSLQPGNTTLNVVVVRNKKETTIAVTIENRSGAIRNAMASSRV